MRNNSDIDLTTGEGGIRRVTVYAPTEHETRTAFELLARIAPEFQALDRALKMPRSEAQSCPHRKAKASA